MRQMIGRELSAYHPTHVERPAGEERLRVDRLSSPGVFEDVSFTVYAGQIEL